MFVDKIIANILTRIFNELNPKFPFYTKKKYFSIRNHLSTSILFFRRIVYFFQLFGFNFLLDVYLI